MKNKRFSNGFNEGCRRNSICLGIFIIKAHFVLFPLIMIVKGLNFIFRENGFAFPYSNIYYYIQNTHRAHSTCSHRAIACEMRFRTVAASDSIVTASIASSIYTHIHTISA